MNSLVKSSVIVHTHPIDERIFLTPHEDDEAEGALYCRQYEDELAILEPIATEFWTVGVTIAEITELSTSQGDSTSGSRGQR
jgi:hypothetical protein